MPLSVSSSEALQDCRKLGSCRITNRVLSVVLVLVEVVPWSGLSRLSRSRKREKHIQTLDLVVWKGKEMFEIITKIK